MKLVDIFFVKVDHKQTMICENHLLSFVNPAKREKLIKYKSEQDRILGIAGELVLQYVLFKEYRICSPTIVYGDYGKPYLKNIELYFNISHSGEIVVLGVSDSNIGVDTEYIHKFDWSMLMRLFGPEEQKNIIDDSSFIKYWTIKEAFVKYLGTGLCTDFRSFTVSENTICYNHQIFFYQCYDSIDKYYISVCMENPFSLSINKIQFSEIMEWTILCQGKFDIPCSPVSP